MMYIYIKQILTTDHKVTYVSSVKYIGKKVTPRESTEGQGTEVFITTLLLGVRRHEH